MISKQIKSDSALITELSGQLNITALNVVDEQVNVSQVKKAYGNSTQIFN